MKVPGFPVGGALLGLWRLQDHVTCCTLCRHALNPCLIPTSSAPVKRTTASAHDHNCRATSSSKASLVLGLQRRRSAPRTLRSQTAALDIKCSQSMDVNSGSGMVLLAYTINCCGMGSQILRVIRIYIYIYTYIQIYVSLYIYIHMPMYWYNLIGIHVCTRIYIYIYTYACALCVLPPPPTPW